MYGPREILVIVNVCARPQHHDGHGPFEQVEGAIKIWIVAAIFDDQTGVRDGCAVAAEKFAGFLHGHSASDVGEIHRDLTSAGNVRCATAFMNDGVVFDTEYATNRDLDGTAHLLVARLRLDIDTVRCSSRWQSACLMVCLCGFSQCHS